jgi:hypothetical protein
VGKNASFKNYEKIYTELCSSIFPSAFTRSLVAIASCKDDNFRRVCLETLRELTIKNAKEVYEACGFRVLFDAVLDHNTKELAEPILLSMLYLLNDASSRYCMCKYVSLTSTSAFDFTILFWEL